MHRAILVKEFDKILKKLDRSILVSIVIDYDLTCTELGIPGINTYTDEEMISLILDQVISNCNSSFEAINVLEEYGIKIDIEDLKQGA